MSLKVHVVEDYNEAAMVRRMFSDEGWLLESEIEDADLVCFVGGEDVNPALYKQKVHVSTFFNVKRDEYETKLYYQALELGIPMVGICRGGQFLNVMNGGELYQDVDKHMGNHKAWIEGAVLPVEVNSVHHQMMIANASEGGKVLMWANQSTKKASMSFSTSAGAYAVMTYPMKEKPTDVEAVFYPNTRCLCYQPHPEYDHYKDKETREIFMMFLNDYILSEAIEEAVA